MTETRIQPSQLDFTSIKNSLKTYLRASGTFTDYDFDGSALNILLDVLAYNTHLQALNANFVLNEAFLDTAQLRSSAISIAKALNYLPRSRTASRVNVTLRFQGVPVSTPDIIIPKYTKISSSIDGKIYNFYTLDEYKAKASDNYIVDVIFYEGKLVKKRFIIDADIADLPVYVIPDLNLYTDSLSVVALDGLYSSASRTLNRPIGVANLNEKSDIYILQESSNGYYELLLGDNIIGVKPKEGTVIEATYLSTNGPDANGAKSFTGPIVVNNFTASFTIINSSYGGSERESIASIKANAPRNFSAQDRAVTVEDYKALISSYATYLETLNVWGGEDNKPPEYGVIYVSLKPQNRDTITETEKTQLRVNVLDLKKIATTTVKFVDPVIQYLGVKANVRYNTSRTALTKQQLENFVKNKIIQFGNENLQTFDTVFYRSKLLTNIDDSENSIVSSDLEISLIQRLKPTYGIDARYEIRFSAPIASVLSQDHVITSDAFEYVQNNQTYTCYIRNKKGTTQIEIYRATVSGEILVVDDAGYIDTATNTVVLIPFGPSGAPDETIGIKIIAVPADQSYISPSRNLLLRIDDVLSSVTAKTLDEV